MDTLKNLVDGTSIMVVVYSCMDLLPHISALASLIWLILRIVESLQNMGYMKKRRVRYTRKDDPKEDES
jgi:hypothetical protein